MTQQEIILILELIAEMSTRMSSKIPGDKFDKVIELLESKLK